MKKILPLLLLVSCAPLSAAHTIVVGQAGQKCPGAQFSRIEDAVIAAAPGATIFICPGIYDEQPLVNKPLTLRFHKNAVVRPSAVRPTGSSLSSGIEFASIVLVTGATNVEIEGGQFDGTQSGITECAPRLFGIVFQNASGTIRRSEVVNMKLNEGLEGCQSGTGVLVQSGNGGISEVAIEGIKVSAYQKNGITIDGAGSFARIVRGRVTGLGPTSGAAQNGIQVGFGAKGEIRKSIVRDNVWAGCVTPENCETFATGVLIEESDGVRLEDNFLDGNNVNLVLNGDGNEAERNSLLDAEVLDDVEVEGSNCSVLNNLIARADRSGVYVAGDNAQVERNTFVDMPIGVFKVQGVQGLELDDNTFIHVADNFKDPPPQRARPLPDRP